MADNTLTVRPAASKRAGSRILFAERMAKSAMSFALIESSGIFRNSADLEMIGIYTTSVPANMIDNKAIGNVSTKQLPSYSVSTIGPPRSTIYSKLSITPIRFSCSPNPAAIGRRNFIDLRPKAIVYCPHSANVASRYAPSQQENGAA